MTFTGQINVLYAETRNCDTIWNPVYVRYQKLIEFVQKGFISKEDEENYPERRSDYKLLLSRFNFGSLDYSCMCVASTIPFKLVHIIKWVVRNYSFKSTILRFDVRWHDVSCSITPTLWFKLQTPVNVFYLLLWAFFNFDYKAILKPVNVFFCWFRYLNGSECISFQRESKSVIYIYIFVFPRFIDVGLAVVQVSSSLGYCFVCEQFFGNLKGEWGISRNWWVMEGQT